MIVKKFDQIHNLYETLVNIIFLKFRSTESKSLKKYVCEWKLLKMWMLNLARFRCKLKKDGLTFFLEWETVSLGFSFKQSNSNKNSSKG